MIGSSAEPAIRRVRRAMAEYRPNLELAEVTLEDRRLPLVLSRLLTPSSNVVDVGGHIGSFLSLAQQFAPRGNHTIIEASETKAAWLRRQFSGSRVECVGISDRTGVAVFYEDPERSGFSRITDRSGPGCQEIKTTTLDAITLGHVDLLKLDIEGGELAALRGATKLIADSRPSIIFECGADANGNFDRRALFDFLESSGYAIHTFGDFLFDKGPLSFDEFRKCGIYPFRAFNFVALRRAGNGNPLP